MAASTKQGLRRSRPAAREARSQAPAEEVRGARILCETLVREGVDTIFGYPGGAVLHIYDELARMRERLRHVLCRHEQGAIHMAEGYAKATGRVGVALVTSGPGATNAVTGIANAFLDSTPIVVITGQVPRRMMGNDAFQEVDTIGITRNCTKYNYLVRDVGDLGAIIREAFYVAGSGRPGPVVIDLPKDVTAEKAVLRVEPDPPRVDSYRPVIEADPVDVRRAVEKIRRARRPILYVGGGIVSSGASAELREFAERLNIPVTPTLMGLGCFPHSHELSLGMLGMHGTYCANMAISESDLIVALGVRFDDRVTGALDKFAPGAEVVHVDIDPGSINKNRRVQIGIAGDAKTVLRRMLDALPTDASGTDRIEEWWELIRSWMKFAPLSYRPSESVIMPQLLVQELARLTDPDAIVATDVGQHQMWLAQYYPFNEPRQSITSGGLGAMGFGFPAALGAQLAYPRRQVVAFVGDGGFQMTAQELATAVQYGASVKIVVMNNNYLGMVRQWQEIFYDGTYSEVDMEWLPDFVKLAEAYGATGLRATRPDRLRDVLERGLSIPGVVLMDILVSPEENVYPMVPSGAGLKEMVLE